MLLNKANEIGFDVITLSQGLQLFAAALPVGIVGLVSGIYQGKVAAASIALAAKQPKHWSNGMIITLTVEMFALFGFLISIFMIG
jgi:V/A-type H+-transporting ATPase subunit K